MLIHFLKKLKRWYLYQRRKKYFPTLRNIFDKDTTIICNNCLGGRIAQDLEMAYNSPTVGLYFFYPDYIRFLQNLSQYLHSPLYFRKKSKYDQGCRNLEAALHPYPIGFLKYGNEEVEIEFLHYHSEKEAQEKWTRRCTRINWNKLIIIGSNNDGCTKEDIEQFLKLPYRKKYFFSNVPYNFSSQDFFFIKEMKKDQNVNVWEKAHVLYKYFKQSFEK